ncbi:MAG TPA: hypothetical protein VN081_02240 [Dongiaceae bacterium]|nr:hypothetical protein [Dongiaceae bacterium]
MPDELPYFGTTNNPAQEADDVAPEVDITVKSELIGMKAALNEILDGLSLDLSQPAAEVKIEALANEKVKKILTPIIATIDTRLKTK